MNDEEEVVYSEPEEQTEQQPTQRRQTLGEQLDNFQQGMSDFGKTVENVGKGEQKVADYLDGGEKVAKVASDAGSAASSAVDKGTEAAEKAAAAREKAAETASKAADKTKKAAATSKNVAQASSKAADAEKAAAQKAASIPYAGAAISAAGQTGAGIHKAAAETQKGASQAVESGAAATKAAADAAAAEAKAEKSALNAANKAAKAGKKANDKTLADKLREKGKIHQAFGKNVQDRASKFDSEKFLTDKFGKAGKALDALGKAFDPKTIVVISLLVLIIGTLFVSYILSPLFFMSLITESADPDNVEKVSNYIAGLGFKDSEQAFYDEVNYLKTHYHDEVDFSYIMSALYYVDIFHGESKYLTSDDVSTYCENMDKEDENTKSACSNLQLGYRLAKFYYQEATTTTGSDGLIYSANKLYRLRDLAKHQFLGSKVEKDATLGEYLSMYASELSEEQKRLFQYLPWLIAYALAHANPDPVARAAFDNMIINTEIGKVLPDLISALNGTESWNSIALYLDTGKYDAGIINAIKDFITSYIDNIKSITFEEPTGEDRINGDSILSSIKVTYYEYSFDQDSFEDYLVDYYIRYMPEYSKYIVDSEGKIDEDKIYKIAKEIKQTKTIFDDIYKTDESAQKYGYCFGDINLDLLSELSNPIDLTIGQTIKFAGTNNYGFYKGTKHNGVDLDADSTGTKAGDNVYSIYEGKVVESTFDDTYSDKDAKGGWLVIDYTVQYNDSSLGNSKLSKRFKNIMSSIRVYYGGLNPSDLKLKSGDIVTKGQIIGHVGDASASETGEKASLHFGIYDQKNTTFLNPINMFITCKKKSASSCTNGGTTLEIPQSVFELKQVNYTITFYDERGFGSLGINGNSDQKNVHQLWLNDGKKYKNGIAIVTIDGTDRYLAAVTKNFASVGDLAFANLEDGTAVPIIIADEKDYANTNNGKKVENKSEPKNAITNILKSG